jgi:hypothetical protein
MCLVFGQRNEVSVVARLPRIVLRGAVGAEGLGRWQVPHPILINCRGSCGISSSALPLDFATFCNLDYD